MRVVPEIFHPTAHLASLLLIIILALGCPGHNQRDSAHQNINRPQVGDELPTVDSPPPGSLRIGLLPERNVFIQKKRYQPLADHLSQELERKVVLRILSRYGNLIDNFRAGELDGAFFGSFTGALAHEKLGVVPLARPEYPDGTSTYHGLVFVRRDSGIRSGGDMEGRSFAFVDKATTAGWLLPMHYFLEQGIDDHESWLGEIYFAGTHEGAIHDVLDKKADIGAAKNTVFDRLASEEPRISEELMILATSPNVPANALLVRGDLDAALITKLRETLLKLDQTEEGRVLLEEFGAARFIPTTWEDYGVVYEFADHIGLDLATYDYNNE